MCLITFAFNAHPNYRFILTANRDEFYVRPTSPANWWEDHPEVFGGRDLHAMGTWMGIHKNGRFAAITNYREIKNIKSGTKTRGNLTTDFLLGTDPPEAYASKVQKKGDEYNGFNLIVLDQEMAFAGNHSEGSYQLDFGIYGLSNALLDTPWPKVEKAKSTFEYLIRKNFKLEDLIEMMDDTEAAADKSLPGTGLDYGREKAFSAMRIRTPDYGTCCTTAIRIDYEGNVEFMEKSYPVGDRLENTVNCQFKIAQNEHV
ncbi:MAG: NRDE family protein [Ekhidna sp.]|nr:NRDE family protein [Ekhidna sp.]